MCLLPCRASNDFLLPTMIAFLNDRSWQLRAAFFAHIPCMASCAGLAGLEAFLLPCLEQARPALIHDDKAITNLSHVTAMHSAMSSLSPE